MFFLFSCSSEKKESEGKQLAKTYCGACHIFPDASLLNKDAWLSKVLPAMSRNLGINTYNGEYYPDLHHSIDSNNNIQIQQSGISIADWHKIVDYYKDEAPDSVPKQNREPISKFTTQFTTHELPLETGGLVATSYIKIDPANHWIYAANAFDSSLNVYDKSLTKISSTNVHGVIVDAGFNTSLQQPGARNGIFTNIGIMNPNDLTTGTMDTFSITSNGSLNYMHKILDSMPRPVQTTTTDFDKDGLPDYLVCGFGNKKGALYWMKNKGNGKFEKKIIRALPGAIKAYIDDYNHDGLPDVMVLMAQAQEGIFLFLNKGNGEFDTKEILRFPPVYGSSYFELDDFNNDGYKDIIYTCGDNADYTAGILKNFHGVYIFLNDGKNNFSQKYFFPINGCYKAIAKDFDKDGDLDIATISFFPDRKNQPQEGFVYLENKGNYNFEASSIHEFSEGSWLTMDAADIDGDGDDDIVIGSLVPPIPASMQQAKAQKNKKAVLLLLENKAK
jgi:hypothetical protein